MSGNRKKNPTQGNQWQVDPRQAEFLKNYFDPKSPTFGNCKQSGIVAGYTELYSENLMSLYPEWLSDFIEDAHLVKKAEDALCEALGYVTLNEDNKVDSGVARVKLDAAKLVLKGLRKEKYSERSELTGKGGQALTFTVAEAISTKHGLTDTETK